MTIDTAPKNIAFTHRGRVVFWSNSDHLVEIERGFWLRHPSGEVGRVEDVLPGGRCVISWDETETTEAIHGWRVQD